MYVYPIAVMHLLTQRCSSVKEVTAKVEEIKVEALIPTASYSTHGAYRTTPLFLSARARRLGQGARRNCERRFIESL